MYQPNINDPRVRTRITQALSWVNHYVKEDTPNWLSTREIDRHLGHSGRDLGQYLRTELLTCIDNHWNYQTGKCKSYIRNQTGVDNLTQLLNGNTVPVVTIPQTLIDQLDSGEFNYEEKADRLFTAWQNIPKRIRNPKMAEQGYRHHYDIQCAAPTLLLQYARQCGLTKETPHLDLYLDDRSFVRQELALQTHLTESEIKEIINALINGASLSHRLGSSILTITKNRHIVVDLLQANEYLTELRTEIKMMWTAIKSYRGISSRLNARTKSAVYREIEKEIILEVKKFMKKTKNKSLLIHDGWICKEVVDLVALRSYVRSQTGYVIEIDWEIYDY